MGCWNIEGSTLWIHSASLLLFAAVLVLSTLWVFERGPFPKLIQKTVFLLNPCSKRKYATHSHMDASDWSPLHECKVFSLTAFYIILKFSFTFKFHTHHQKLYLPAWFVVIFTVENWGEYGLLLETLLTAWISKLYCVWACRLRTVTRRWVSPRWRGEMSTLSSQREHIPRSGRHFLQMTLYRTSSRPPRSLGSLHSRTSEVSLTIEMTFRGEEGIAARRTMNYIRKIGLDCEFIYYPWTIDIVLWTY